MNAAELVLAPSAQTTAWQEDLYRDLHAHPELSHGEHASAATMAARMRDLGFDVTEGIGGTGVVGVLRNGDGPTVLMRADMDALPVEERTGLGYASSVRATGRDGAEVPVMHACGHDMHMTWLLGACELLAQGAARWSGTYVALFQPAEETGDGAAGMVADGLVDRVPRPDVVMGQHVMRMRAGRVAARSGPAMAQADSVRITLHGRGAHGSMPQFGVDPVVLAAAVVLRLQTIVSREVPPLEFAVVTVGAVHAGTTSNIISDSAELLVNVRSYDTAVRERVLAAVERIVRAECAAAGSPAEPEIVLYDQVPLTSNDDGVTHVVRAAFEREFGADAVESELITGSEDFSHLPAAWGAPSLYWFVGGTDPEVWDAAASAGRLLEDVPSNHSPFFAPALRPTIEVGTRAAVVAALAYLAP